MIEIEAVQPTAREFRSIRRGWGLIHWVCLLPTHAFLIGFVLFGVVALAVSDNTQAHGLFSVFLIGSWLLSLIGGSVVRRPACCRAGDAAIACGQLAVALADR